MNICKLLMLFLSLWVMSALGCGFGGFSGSGSETPSGGSNSATDTKLQGVVSKGPFKSGTVKFYAISSDGSETLLKTASIGAFGNYSASLSSPTTSSSDSYSGIVMIKATGSYSDEATGALLTVDDSNPLRAIVANPSTTNISVTPLTELAVRKALLVLGKNSQLTANDVSEANGLVSEMFKVDIIATKPLEPNGFGEGTTQAQRDYTLALAAISQVASSSGSLSNTLSALADDISDGAMSAENAAIFQSALTSFLASDKNLTGVSDINSTNLVNAGGTIKSIRIGTAGELGAGSNIGGVSATVILPPGVRVKADLRDPAKLVKEPLSGVVKGSGVIAARTELIASYLAPSGALPGMVRLGLASDVGFPAGEFATITCDVPAGLSLSASDFSIYKNVEDPTDPKNSGAWDGNGAAYAADLITVEILPD